MKNKVFTAGNTDMWSLVHMKSKGEQQSVFVSPDGIYSNGDYQNLTNSRQGIYIYSLT